MSLTSYRAAPPRDPENRHIAGGTSQRKRYFKPATAFVGGTAFESTVCDRSRLDDFRDQHGGKIAAEAKALLQLACASTTNVRNIAQAMFVRGFHIGFATIYANDVFYSEPGECGKPPPRSILNMQSESARAVKPLSRHW